MLNIKFQKEVIPSEYIQQINSLDLKLGFHRDIQLYSGQKWYIDEERKSHLIGMGGHGPGLRGDSALFSFFGKRIVFYYYFEDARANKENTIICYIENIHILGSDDKLDPLLKSDFNTYLKLSLIALSRRFELMKISSAIQVNDSNIKLIAGHSDNDWN